MRILNETSNLPFGTLWHIQLILRWIPELDLMGIDCIRLMDKMPSLTSKSPNWHIRAQKEGFLVNGAYSKRSKSNPPFIILFINDLYYPLPKAAWSWPVSSLRIVQFLAHETGHHLIEERGFVFTPDEKYLSDTYKEEMANRYAFEITGKMKKKWYYRMGASVIRFVSDVYSGRGREEWQRKNFRGAAMYWYKAWCLNPERQELVEGYWRAKKMCDG